MNKNNQENTLQYNPFISICIPSYNRIYELQRCLESIDVINPDSIEIIVSEDCSPKRKEIIDTVKKYSDISKHKVRLNSNDLNLGYDRNLGKLISLARGEYIILMNDDDALIKGALDKTIQYLKRSNCAIAFTPFFNRDSCNFERQFKIDFSFPPKVNEVSKYLYCSILNSGLIFKRNYINDYDPARFINLNYFQVYLFASVVFNYGGQYINIPLIDCFADGENGFGKNESSVKNELLADRSSIFSNLEYHKGLIKTIKIFDADNKTNVIKAFSKEYCLRSYSGLAKAKRSSNNDLNQYWKRMNLLDIKITWVAKMYYLLLLIFGYTTSNLILNIPKNILLLNRKNK